MSHKRKDYWNVVKWLLRYLKETTSTSFYYRIDKVVLEGFIYVDLGGDLNFSRAYLHYR